MSHFRPLPKHNKLCFPHTAPTTPDGSSPQRARDVVKPPRLHSLLFQECSLPLLLRPSLLRGWSSRSRHENRRNWLVGSEKKRPQISQALTSPATTPATQHQQLLILAARALRGVGHTASKVWRHLAPCESRTHRQQW